MLNLAVFASGKGSNCHALIIAIAEGRLDATLNLVISNKRSSDVLDIASKNGTPFSVIRQKDFKDEKAYSDKLLEMLAQYDINFIVLAGFLQKIPLKIIERFRSRIINIHPALLPAFGGKGMYGRHVHEAVISYGSKISGITVHLVDEEYDHGPIVLQRTVGVEDEDTPESLAERIQALEHAHYAEAIQLFAQNRVELRGRQVIISD